MRVAVINMASHADRRAATAGLLGEAGIEFDFFPAIRGEDAISKSLFDRIDEHEFLLNTGRNITAGEIGCYASHRALWRKCAKENRPYVIMEDDFRLLDSFEAALSVSRSIIGSAGFIRLQTDLRAKKCEVTRIDGFVLSRFTKPPHGLMCYCISPDTARRFVAATCVLVEPVDIFTKKYWDHGQPMYVLTPHAVTASTYHSTTTITGRKKATKPLAVAAHRFLRKIGLHIRRWRFNWRLRHDRNLIADNWLGLESAAKSAEQLMTQPASRYNRRTSPARAVK
ncbi:MAG: glycosyltransferase family 25 protein [Woeseiaceae bacterium]|nr:glycosyltransferase family 25 protein [Woeseiaceae bacterium]